MLELPEVEVLRRDLEREVVGRRIKEAEVRANRNAMKVVKRHGRRKDFQDLLEGAKVEKVDRVGRALLLELDNGHVFVIDLGEAGLVLKTSSSEDMATHTHVVISFTIGGQIRIVDPMLTTELYVIERPEAEEMAAANGFLIDPLSHQFTWHYLSTVLEERDTPMKALLSDPKFICGLGPVYSDEVLFTAALRYDHPSSKLTSQDVRRLYRSLLETLQEAVKARGASVGEHPFRDLLGAPGTYQDELKVFEKEGEACRRCRHAIVKTKFGASLTYYCPQCQS